MGWFTFLGLIMAAGLDAPTFEYDLEDLYVHKMGFCAVSGDAAILTFMGAKQGLPSFEIAVFDFQRRKAALVDDGRVRPMGVPFAIAVGQGFALFDIRPNAPPWIYRISREAVFEDIQRPQEFEGWEASWSIRHVAPWTQDRALVTFRDLEASETEVFLALVDPTAETAIPVAARSLKQGLDGYWAARLPSESHESAEVFWVEPQTGLFELLDSNGYFDSVRALTQRMPTVEKSAALRGVFKSIGMATSPFQEIVHVPGSGAGGLPVQWRQFHGPDGTRFDRSRRQPFTILAGEGTLTPAHRGLPLAQSGDLRLCLDIEEGALTLVPKTPTATAHQPRRAAEAAGPPTFFSVASSPYADSAEEDE